MVENSQSERMIDLWQGKTTILECWIAGVAAYPGPGEPPFTAEAKGADLQG